MLVRRTPLGARFRTLSRYCQERDTLSRSCTTALVVGTFLGVINHGSALLAGQWTTAQVVPLLISYLVLFTVVMYGQIQGKRQRDQARIGQRERLEPAERFPSTEEKGPHEERTSQVFTPTE